MEFQNNKVIVTGGAGFIGRNVIQELYRQGARVFVFDLPEADFSAFPTDVQIIKGDILNQQNLIGVFDDCDYVFHLAARTDLNGKTIKDYVVNYEGTKNIIEALKNNKNLQKLVVYSTQLVVGIYNETRFIGPDEPFKTKTLYGESKILTEKITKELCQKYEIPYLIIRPTSVYGPYGKEPYRSYFLTIKKHSYFNIGKANNLVSMSYVKNLVDQTMFLATKEAANGKVFYGTDFHPYNMGEFSNAAANYWGYRLRTLPDLIVYPAAYVLGIFKLLGINVPLYPFRLNNIKANYCYDISNLIQLGFFPKYGLDDGIKDTLDWYTQNDKEFI